MAISSRRNLVSGIVAKIGDHIQIVNETDMRGMVKDCNYEYSNGYVYHNGNKLFVDNQLISECCGKRFEVIGEDWEDKTVEVNCQNGNHWWFLPNMYYII